MRCDRPFDRSRSALFSRHGGRRSDARGLCAALASSRERLAAPRSVASRRCARDRYAPALLRPARLDVEPTGRPYPTIRLGPVASANGCAQNAQRRAAIGTSLRHSGHFFVVGSAGASPLRRLAASAFMGATTKK